MVFAEVALRLLNVGAPRVREGSSGFTFFSHDPNLGWDLVPGAGDRLTTDEFDVKIEITEQGLRSHRTFSRLPEPTGRRVLVIGDSFSFGHGVDVEAAWPARLEEALKQLTGEPAAVINQSVTGYGTDQQILRLEDRGFQFRPDTVVLGLFVGNVFRNARHFQIGYPKPRFVLDGGKLKLTHVPVPEGALEPRGPSRLLHVAGSTWRMAREHLGYGEAWAVTEALLQRLERRCRAEGAELLVVVIPKDRLIYGQGQRRRIHQRTQDRAVEMLEALNLPHLDLAPVLKAAKDTPGGDTQRLYFPIDGHWTEEAHRLAADAIADRLLATGRRAP